MRKYWNVQGMVCAGLFFMQCTAGKQAVSVSDDLQERVEHTILVSYTDASGEKQIEKALKKYDAQVMPHFENLKMMSVYIPETEDVTPAIALQKEMEAVKIVECDQIVSIKEECGECIEMEVVVASETRIGYGVAPQTCMLVKFSPEEKWQYMYDSIEGFEYELGYEYRLFLERAARKNPPQDSSKYVYRLKKVLDKQKKQSENLLVKKN